LKDVEELTVSGLTALFLHPLISLNFVVEQKYKRYYQLSKDFSIKKRNF
jgi:hypothetical protein